MTLTKTKWPNPSGQPKFSDAWKRWVYLTFLEGYSQKAIAASEGCSVSSVGRAVSWARKKNSEQALRRFRDTSPPVPEPPKKISVWAWVDDGKILYKINRWGLKNAGPAIYIEKSRAERLASRMKAANSGARLVELSGR